ncbi:MAG: ABC transporter ATP-binding protein [Alphaproteobacteria bacterium]
MAEHSTQETTASETGSLLDVRDLAVAFPSDAGELRAVDGVSYAIAPHRTLGVVGESGCGKTVAALALLRLVPPPGRISGGEIVFDGTDLLALPETAMPRLRGDRIAMIFQEPMTALNPVYPVGDQIAEVLVAHRGARPREALAEAVDLLARVGIPAPERRAADYPHSLSGGMRQRAMIAMALACRPALLIADEPTTALDVTVQAQILELLLKLQDEVGMAVQFISHNLGVISEIADEIVVMYAGRIVESAPASELMAAPAHPYTRGLLETVPRVGRRQRRLPAIPGAVPAPGERIAGCRFRNRCPLAVARCAEAEPALETIAPGHRVACFVAAEGGT